jgi:hypothetical protein
VDFPAHFSSHDDADACTPNLFTVTVQNKLIAGCSGASIAIPFRRLELPFSSLTIQGVFFRLA